jgi:hypothetical protein
LMTLFAGQLDGAVSLGDALRNAKQQYFGSQGLYGAYDEKALSSTILYGLPMFAVGTVRPVREPPPNETTTPVAGAAGLSSTPYSQDFTFAARSVVSVGGTKPMPAPARSCHRSRPAVRFQPVPTSTSQPRRPAARCSGSRCGRQWTSHGSDRSRLRRRIQSPNTRQRRRRARPSTPSPRSPLAWRVSRRRATPRVRRTRRCCPASKLVLIPGQFLSTAPGDPNGRGTQILYNRMSGAV